MDKTVIVAGKRYRTRVPRAADAVPGTWVRSVFNRCAYRLVCEDGDELVLRNIRHPDLFETCTRRELLEDFLVVDAAE